MFLTAVFWWWWEFRLDRLEVWTFQVYTFVILFAVALYLLCAMLFPPSLDRYDGFKGYFASLGPEYIVVRVVKISLCVVAMRTENEPFIRCCQRASPDALRFYDRVG
jgi:hypothetical protein